MTSGSSIRSLWTEAFRRGVCLGVSVSLCLSGPGPAAASLDASARVEALSPAAVSIPAALGEIQEKYQGDAGKTVILIQDAHSVYEAQKSIEGLFHFFQEKYGVNLMGVEGGSGVLSPFLLQSHPDREYRARIMEDYLQQGELSGAVTAAAAFPRQSRVRILALEDKALYESAIRAYQASVQVREPNSVSLLAAEQTLETAKKRLYSPEFLAFDSLDRNFRSGGSRNLAEYLLTLSRIKTPDSFPAIAAMLEQIRQADSTMNEETSRELESLIAWLGSLPLDKEEVMELNRRVQSYRTSEIESASAAAALLELARARGLEAGRFPKLEKMTAHYPVLSAMKGPFFFSELEAYASQIRSAFLTSPEIKALHQVSEKLLLLKSLNQLELTLDQWRFYLAMGSFETLRIEMKAAGLASLPDGWGVSLASAESFYEAAEARDHVFMRKMIQAMERENEQNFLFLAGGFHSGGLTALLREAGLSYVLVMPRISAVPENSAYERVMKGDVSWKSFFRSEKGEVDLEAAFNRGAVRRLMNPAWGDESGRYLKLWRDEILRLMSAKGELDQTGAVTRYLDEAVDGSVSELSEAFAELLLERLRAMVFENRVSRDHAAQIFSVRSAMPFTNINVGSLSADLLGLEISPQRSELRAAESDDRLGMFRGISRDMPVIDFLAAFGIDAESAVLTPVEGMPDFARVPVAITPDTLESAAAIFLSENTRVQGRVYVKAAAEGSLDSLRDLYLLTYQGRPAAMIWAMDVPAGGLNSPGLPKTLIYPLLSYQQGGLFAETPDKESYPPFPDMKQARGFYDSVITPYVRRAHGTAGYFNNLNILDDPYHESPQSAMNVRVYGDLKSGFAFPGSYGPWEHSTVFLLDMLDAHLLPKLGRANLEGLNLVDVGSGAGRVSVYLAQKGALVQAYDLTLMKAMNTKAWARVNKVPEKVRARKALSVTELESADGYIVNFPNLDENAKRLEEIGLMKYEDSRHLNISIHPDDFRKVMMDLRDSAKPGAFLFIRGNYTGRGLELFMPIMRETGWTEGLEAPLSVPEGIESFGAAYFLRQNILRSELRAETETESASPRERDLDLREKYERILREASYGRHLEALLNDLLDALERPEASRILVWKETPGTALDQIVNALRSANSHYKILSPGSLKKGDHLMVLEAPGVGVHGLGQKELNAIFGEEKVNRLIELRRQALHEVLNENRLYDFGEEVLYSTYKEDVVRLRLLDRSPDFPESGKWSYPGGAEALAETIRTSVIEELTQVLRNHAGPYRRILELPANRELLAKKGITDIDRQPLFELNFGMSQVKANSASSRLNADINAHQALTLANISEGKTSRLFQPEVYRSVVLEMSSLRELLVKGPSQGNPVLEGEAGGRTLTTAGAEILRKRYAWNKLDQEQQRVFGNDPDYYGAAQRYFDLLRLQDYIKKWDIDFASAVREATRIRLLISKLEHYRRLVQIITDAEDIDDFADDETIIRDRDKRLLQELPPLLLNDSRRRSLASPRWFHSVVPAMKNPVYVNLDVKGMGIMNVRAFELEIQQIEKLLRENGSVTEAIEKIWQSSADDVTRKVQGIEGIIRDLAAKAYQRAGVQQPVELAMMMGGDEVIFALDGDFFQGSRLDELLFDVRAEIKRALALDIRAGVSERIEEYRKNFEYHARQADVAHASLILGIDDITGMLKRLESLEARGALDTAYKEAIVYHVPGAESASWKGKVRDSSGVITSFDALEAAELSTRSELRAVEPRGEAEDLIAARVLAREVVKSLFEGKPADQLAGSFAELFGETPRRSLLWQAFESAYVRALREKREAPLSMSDPENYNSELKSFVSSGRLFTLLNQKYASLTGVSSSLAEQPDLPVAFAIGEKLIYQAGLGAAGDSIEDVKAILRTSLEDGGSLIFATRSGSSSGEASSRLLDKSLRELGGEVRADRVKRLQTGAVTPLDQFESRLGKDGDVSRFVVFVEQGDSEVLPETQDQKKRGLVFVIDAEVLALLSVSDVMRILKNLALVPERLREFYRDELGLRPNPQSGLTMIGRDFLNRLADLFKAETQILTSA